MSFDSLPPLDVLHQMLQPQQNGPWPPGGPPTAAEASAPAPAPGPAPVSPVSVSPLPYTPSPVPAMELPTIRDPNEAFTGWADRAASAVHSLAAALDPGMLRRTSDRRGAMFIKGLADAWANDRLGRVAGRQQKIQAENEATTSAVSSRNAANIALWQQQNNTAFNEQYQIRAEDRALSNEEKRARSLAAIEMSNIEPRMKAEIQAGLANGKLVRVPGYGVVQASELLSLDRSREMQAKSIDAQKYAQMFNLIPTDVQQQITSLRQQANALRNSARDPMLASNDPASQRKRNELISEAKIYEARANQMLQNLRPAVYANIAQAPEQFRAMLALYAEPMLSTDDGGASYSLLLQQPAYDYREFERMGYNQQQSSLVQMLQIATDSDDQNTKRAAAARVNQILTDPRYVALTKDKTVGASVISFVNSQKQGKDSSPPPPSYTPPPSPMVPNPGEHPVNATGADSSVRVGDTLSLDTLNTMFTGAGGVR